MSGGGGGTGPGGRQFRGPQARATPMQHFSSLGPGTPGGGQPSAPGGPGGGQQNRDAGRNESGRGFRVRRQRFGLGNTLPTSGKIATLG